MVPHELRGRLATTDQSRSLAVPRSHVSGEALGRLSTTVPGRFLLPLRNPLGLHQVLTISLCRIAVGRCDGGLQMRQEYEYQERFHMVILALRRPLSTH